MSDAAGEGTSMSVERLTEEIRRRAETSPSLGYKVKFVLEEGGVIFWDGEATPPQIGNGDEAASTTIRISAKNLEKLLAGGLDPTLAYMTGKLKVEGSLGVALKLTGLLGD